MGGDVEALLRASMASVFKSVGAGVRAIQKRQAMPTEVRVKDLFDTLKKGNPRFGFPELKRLIPGSDRSETVSWVELGLEAEAARPAPQASVRASVAIEQLSDLLTDAARDSARALRPWTEEEPAFDNVIRNHVISMIRFIFWPLRPTSEPTVENATCGFLAFLADFRGFHFFSYFSSW